MSQIRKAYSVEIIDKRLRDAEVAGGDDVMELIGLHDELARVDRKWREKSTSPRPAKGPRSRPLANADQMNARFERLTRLIDARLRRAIASEAEAALLKRAADSLHARRPLTTGESGIPRADPPPGAP